jgi:5-methylthioadenosine/S-adenosylhomocysteine deaminase
VVIAGKAPNIAPIMDPVAAVTLCADVSNVETVIIDGKVHKRDGSLLADVERARALAEGSRDYLVGKVKRHPAWTGAAPAPTS